MSMVPIGKPRETKATRFPPREGSRQTRKKSARSRSKIKVNRRIKINGAPRCYKKFAQMKSCRSTAYKQYGSSSDTKPAYIPLRMPNPYRELEELEQHVYRCSKLVSSGIGSPCKRLDKTSSDSYDEYVADTKHQGGGDDVSVEDDSQDTQEESESLQAPCKSCEDGVDRTITDLLRQRRTALMEAIVKQVSPTRRIDHLQAKGYFHHDYNKHARSTPNMANLMQGHKKGIQNLYAALNVRIERSIFKGRSLSDKGTGEYSRGSRHDNNQGSFEVWR